MKPWVRFAFILVAYSLALIHTAVPHHHGSGHHRKVTITHAGCEFNGAMGRFLQMVFSADLGYGHLETFSGSSGTKMNAVPVSPLPAIVTPFLSLQVLYGAFGQAFNGYVPKLCHRLILFSATPFRAPPMA